MPLVAYVPDASRYNNVFVSQFGTGVMTHYRGSPYQNGSGFIPQILKNLFSKIGNFVKPILRQAAPHAKAAMEAAAPHLKEAAISRKFERCGTARSDQGYEAVGCAGPIVPPQRRPRGGYH